MNNQFVQKSIPLSAKEVRLFMRRIKKAISELNNNNSQENEGEEVDEIFSTLLEDDDRMQE